VGKRRSGGRAQRSKPERGASLASRLKAREAERREGLDPLLYVALHSGSLGDVAFYLSECLGPERLQLRVDEEGGLVSAAPEGSASPEVSVLELGCGAGRITLPLLEGGARVVGVDTHQGLLSLLELTAQERGLTQRLKLVHEDMRTLHLKERFDFVLITYNTLYCALTWDEQVDCLSRAAAHLKPSGRLLIDGYALPDPEDFLYETDEDFEPLTVVELPTLSPAGALPDTLWRLSDQQYLPLTELEAELESEVEPKEAPAALSAQELSDLDDEPLNAEDEARVVGVEERDVHEQSQQRCDVYYRFRWASGAQRDELIEHRYLFPKQLPEMLESAGLVGLEWWSDFEPGEPNEDTEQWALSAQLKGSNKLTQRRRR